MCSGRFPSQTQQELATTGPWAYSVISWPSYQTDRSSVRAATNGSSSS